MTPSMKLRRLAQITRDDNERGRLLRRAFALEACAPLTRSLAFKDLGAAAYFHAQPCACDRCNLAVKS